MARLTIQTEWKIDLTTAELRLILQALGGRLKPPDMEEANALGNRLSIARANATTQAMQQADKLMQNLINE